MSKTRVWVLCAAACVVLLCGCKIRRSYTYRSSGQATIEVHLAEEDSMPVSARSSFIERQWTSPRQWRARPHQARLYLETTYSTQDHPTFHHSLAISEDDILAWPESGRPGESVELTFHSDLGNVRFSGKTGPRGASGSVTIEVGFEALRRLEKTFNESPPLEVVLPLICKKLDTANLVEYTRCDIKITISQAGDLACNGFSATDIQALIRSGHTFEAADYIELARHHVSPDYIVTWKKQDYTLSADQLVYAHQRNLDAGVARQWKDVGYDVNLEEIYWIKNRNLNPASAVAWKAAGYDLSLDQLYWIKNRNLSPESAVEWAKAGYNLDPEDLYWAKTRNLGTAQLAASKAAGYPLDLEQLYWAKNRNLSPQTAADWKHAGFSLDLKQLSWAKDRNLSPGEAGKWREANYSLPLEDLYRLKQYNVTPEFGAALSNPVYEPFSVEELIKLKQSNLSSETLKKLRQPKRQ